MEITCPTRYRRKTGAIDAFQMTVARRLRNDDWPRWMHDAWQADDKPNSIRPAEYPASDGTDQLMIITTGGSCRVAFGDWIIRDDDGSLYTCRPDLFALLYEPE